MNCEFCHKEVETWWVHEEKWCCEECKRKFDKNLLQLNDKKTI